MKIHNFGCFLLLITLGLPMVAQVGIGTTTPDVSSILDLKTTNKGFLAPRMTTVQRNAITGPAKGLIVFDTVLNDLFIFDGLVWTRNLTDKKNRRENYVLVKKQADFPAPAGGVITLDTNTIYEVNGTILLTNSINLNGAYIIGLHTNEDVLSRTGGTVFSGNKGGSLRNLTLTATGANGKIFDITSSTPESLIAQSCVVRDARSVGLLKGFDIVFFNVMQYINTGDGITFDSVTNLLLNNQGWFGNNLGTYEKFVGSFNLIQKESGFSQVVAGGTIGLDATGVTSISGSATLQNVVFYGGGTYVKGTNTYTGFNFTKDWSVNCSGIPVENDDVATGNLFFTGSTVTVLNNGAIKLPVTTSTTRNFRTSGPGTNRIVYEGKKLRSLNIFGAVSFTAIAGMRMTFSIYKNGSLVPGTAVVYDINDTNGRQALSILGTVLVNPADYIEVYVERNAGSGSNQFLVTSYNLLVN